MAQKLSLFIDEIFPRTVKCLSPSCALVSVTEYQDEEIISPASNRDIVSMSVGAAETAAAHQGAMGASAVVCWGNSVRTSAINTGH